MSRRKARPKWNELRPAAAAISSRLTDGGQVELPLTQTVIGDALGLTPVHVNRILRKLRQRGVMSLKGGSLVISDVDELVSIAGFDDNYLHRRLSRGTMSPSTGLT